MKHFSTITLTFKQPDVLDALEDEKQRILEDPPEGVDEEEFREEVECEFETFKEKIEKYLQYGEYLSVEFSSSITAEPIVLKGRR